MPMTMTEYQKRTNETAVFPTCFVEDRKDDNNMVETRWVYCALGLVGESGEVAEKLKKVLRDNNGVISKDDKNLIAKELGDVLWYVSELATAVGLDLEYIACHNLQKLADRAERGVLQGSGDTR